MIANIKITKTGIEYHLNEDAPNDAREQLADAGNPTNPTVAKDVIDTS